MKNVLDMPGAYVLVCYLQNPSRLAAGKLGNLSLPAGYFAYVGSAMKGYSARLPHYLKPVKKAHWHIDYLLQTASLHKILLFPSLNKQECLLAGFLLARFEHVPGFGCSDCRCASHLVFSQHNYSLEREIQLMAGEKGVYDIAGIVDQDIKAGEVFNGSLNDAFYAGPGGHNAVTGGPPDRTMCSTTPSAFWRYVPEPSQ
jgi:Uri superfamily endonuclease